jgi:succinyl-diaminopimelate desuccinylase
MVEKELKDLLPVLKKWIAGRERELAEDIKTLVAIPSITTTLDRGTRYPFGEANARVVDTAETLIRRYGLGVKSYDYYGIAASCSGTGTGSIGFFSHLDVVPPGDGWASPPFEPIEKDGYIIGRGASDNKGPAMAALYSLRFLKEQGIPLKHRLFCFLGCNEESGMEDVRHFLEVDEAPALALVSDSNFPVCNGEKGILTAHFVRPLPPGNLLSFTGGTASNVVPNQAEAVIKAYEAAEVKKRLGEDFQVEETDRGTVHISARGISGHAARPEHTVNALQKLAAALIGAGLVDQENRRVLAFVADSFGDYYGGGLQIDFEDTVSGKTTHVGSTARVTADGLLDIGINVRYAISAPQDELIQRLSRKAGAYGYELRDIHNDPPYYIPPDDTLAVKLTSIVNQTLGTSLTPFVMGGGTHARKLPRALGFGAGRQDLPPPFGPNAGGAHQVNEAFSMRHGTEAIEIYVQALLTLDEIIP